MHYWNLKAKRNQEESQDLDEVSSQACQTNIDADNIYVKSMLPRLRIQE